MAKKNKVRELIKKVKLFLEPKLSVKEMTKPIGNSGTRIMNGYISEEYNGSLAGSNGYTTYRQMWLSDAQVHATVLMCMNPILSTEWYIDPADDDGEITDEYKEQAEFIEKALFKDNCESWQQTLREALSSMVYGFAVLEKVYKLDENGKITIDKLGSRKQSTILRWQMQNGGEGVQQTLVNPNEMGEYIVDIPMQKLLVFSRCKEGDNYEGVSILRAAHKHWWIKNELYKFDSVRQEKTSMPPLVGRAPSNATQEERTAFADELAQVKVNEKASIVLAGKKEDGWDIEAIDFKVSGASDLYESIKHHNTEIPKAILANFIDLGTGTSSGSYSLDDSKKVMFLQALETEAKAIADVFNKYLIEELIDLNFETDKYPRLNFKGLVPSDNSITAQMFANLTNAKLITPDMETEQFIRKMFEMPPKEEEEDEVEIETPEIEEPQEKEMTPEEMDKEMEKDMAMEANENDDYWEFSQKINNKAIIKLQSDCKSDKDFQELKKKGYKLNEFESESPRQMTFAERKVNFKSLKKSMEAFTSKLGKHVSDITERQKKEILKQITDAINKNDIKALSKINVSGKSDLSGALTDIQKEMFDIGKKSAATEMGVKVPPTKPEVKGAMRVQNDSVVETLTKDMTEGAKQAATQIINKRGGAISSVSAAAVIGEVANRLDNIIAKVQNKINTLGVIGSVNMGRSSVYEQYPDQVYAVQYSAILDERTTNRCLSLDGRVVKAGSDDYYKYSPPQHYNCRSIWVEILNDEEFKPKIGKIPVSIPASTNIDDSQDLITPKLLKNSPSIGVVKEEIKDLEDRLSSLQESGLYKNRQEALQKQIDDLKKAIGE